MTPSTRRIGYTAAAVASGVVLFALNNLLAWEFPPFLTEDFNRVLPLVNVSLGATIAMNLIFVAYDAGRFKALGEIGPAGLSLVVVIRTYQVFPFDFSAYSFNWTAVTRAVLILAMIGIGIGIVVQIGKLAGATTGRPPRRAA